MIWKLIVLIFRLLAPAVRSNVYKYYFYTSKCILQVEVVRFGTFLVILGFDQTPPFGVDHDIRSVFAQFGLFDFFWPFWNLASKYVT